MTEHPANASDRPTAPEPSPTDGQGDTRTLDPAVAEAEVGLSAGESIGPYRLLEIIGVGGFGVVWLAEQREPIRRRVALKVIKPGMDSAAVIARFGAERNALSVMDHPNIARVLDGGTTDRGLPYFVMEHVPGEPITSYCQRKKLGLNERLEVFGQVCQAVQHAHTKGVIHRDLKPSNILVREVDDKPVAKVIDFGVAKALDQRLSEQTIFTARGHMIGTPEYMAPEQAEGSGRDIDTRADVYSLGVVLYELLTGVRPFEFREIAYHEVTRVIAEVEPPRPSTRMVELLSDLRASDEATSGETRSIARALKSDLDWVVMKCLEKDRSHRYGAVATILQDVSSYIMGDTISARAPSTSYKLKRVVRRHWRGLAVSAVLAAFGLVASVAVGRAIEHAAQAASLDEMLVAAETRAAERLGGPELSRSELLLRHRLETLQIERPRRTMTLGGHLAEIAEATGGRPFVDEQAAIEIGYELSAEIEMGPGLKSGFDWLEELARLAWGSPIPLFDYVVRGETIRVTTYLQRRRETEPALYNVGWLFDDDDESRNEERLAAIMNSIVMVSNPDEWHEWGGDDSYFGDTVSPGYIEIVTYRENHLKIRDLLTGYMNRISND